MASEASSPIWTATPPKRGAMAFATLFAVESLARSLIATVVSVQAHDLLQDSQRVSVLFTSVSILVLASSLLLPHLFRHLARRWVYTLGAMALIGACSAFATFTLPGQVVGMFLRNVGAATLNVTLSLYILDHIRRADLVRSEPLRLTLSTLSWTVGPYLGVWLYQNHGVWAPQIVSISVSLILIALFWHLRLSDHPVIRAGKTSAPVTPLRNVHRFLAQPRLRLAWLVAFGRSCFWSTFFIYGPLLMIEGNLGKEAGGLLISAGNAVLCTAFIFGRLSEKVGVRVVIAGAFAGAAVVSMGAGIAGVTAPVIAALFLLAGSIATSALDGVGGIPFLRAVRAHERPQMTAVYRSYIDFSDLIPSFIYSFALLFFPLGIVFVILGFGLAAVGLVAWIHLPRSM